MSKLLIGKVKMNDNDEKILGLLRDNARLSISAIADVLKLSRTTVQKRIEYMEKKGIITGYTIRMKPTAEKNLIRAWMSIQVEGNKASLVIQQLRLNPAVHELHTTNGKWDLLVELTADTLQNFDKVLEQIRKISGIYNTETSILLTTYKV